MAQSNKVYDVIKIILKNEGFITVGDIAEQIGTSKRTIFRMMDQVEEILNEGKIDLEKKTRKGIKAVGEPDAVENILSNLGDHDRGYTQEDRQRRLIIELLQSREPEKLFYFSKLLKVSEATISNDMDKLEGWFEKRELTLIRKPGFGVSLEGSEKALRKAIVDFLYQNYNHKDLVALIQKEDSDQVLEKILKEADENLLSLINRNVLIKVNSSLKQYETYLEKRLTEGAYIGLMIHLSIAVQRLLNNERIHMNPKILDDLRNDKNFKKAEEIARTIEATFSITVPEDELGFITMHLKGSKLKTAAMVENNDFIVTNFELSQLGLKMIRSFKESSGYDFINDDKLLVGLVSHLRPALTRMKLNLDIRNPLLEKIKEMYPEIFRMSREAVSVIESKYSVSVPDAEIGYLAMHFGAAIERQRKAINQAKVLRIGVVCSSGVGTSSLLKSKLAKAFPKMMMVGQFSKSDLENGLNETVDLLVSTIAVESKEYPLIVVNPLLPDEDIEKVEQTITVLKQSMNPFREVAEKKKPTINRIQLINTLTEGILQIQKNFKVTTLEDVENLEYLIHWVAKGFGQDEGVLDIEMKLNERERLGSTVLKDEKLILLHTQSRYINELNVSVARINSIPVIRNNALINIETALIMLIPEDIERNKLEIMSLVSKELIENDNFVSLLKRAPEEEIADHLQGLMSAWLDKKLSSI